MTNRLRWHHMVQTGVYPGRIAMADEPLFMAVRESDPAYQRTVQDAQASLGEFRRFLRDGHTRIRFPCVKTRVTAGAESALIWLLAIGETSSGFVAEVFEIPPEFHGIAPGQRIDVPAADVMDWMVNDGGKLHGGFSLRYQRSQLPPDKRAWYDSHIGVSE